MDSNNINESSSKGNLQNSKHDLNARFDQITDLLVTEKRVSNEKDIQDLITILRRKVNNKNNETETEQLPSLKNVKIKTKDKTEQRAECNTIHKIPHCDELTRIDLYAVNENNSKKELKKRFGYKGICPSKANSLDNLKNSYQQSKIHTTIPSITCKDKGITTNKYSIQNDKIDIKQIPRLSKKDILKQRPSNMRFLSQDRSDKFPKSNSCTINGNSKLEGTTKHNNENKRNLSITRRPNTPSVPIKCGADKTSQRKETCKNICIKTEASKEQHIPNDKNKVRRKWSMPGELNSKQPNILQERKTQAVAKEKKTNNFLKDRNLLFNKVCDLIVEEGSANGCCYTEEVTNIFTSMIKREKNKNKNSKDFIVITPEMPKWAIKGLIKHGTLLENCVPKRLTCILKGVLKYITHEKGRIQESDIAEFLSILQNKLKNTEIQKVTENGGENTTQSANKIQMDLSTEEEIINDDLAVSQKILINQELEIINHSILDKDNGYGDKENAEKLKPLVEETIYKNNPKFDKSALNDRIISTDKIENSNSNFQGERESKTKNREILEKPSSAQPPNSHNLKTAEEPENSENNLNNTHTENNAKKINVNQNFTKLKYNKFSEPRRSKLKEIKSTSRRITKNNDDNNETKGKIRPIIKSKTEQKLVNKRLSGIPILLKSTSIAKCIGYYKGIQNKQLTLIKNTERLSKLNEEEMQPISVSENEINEKYREFESRNVEQSGDTKQSTKLKSSKTFIICKSYEFSCTDELDEEIKHSLTDDCLKEVESKLENKLEEIPEKKIKLTNKYSRIPTRVPLYM